jgi:hypothetical protein
MIKISEGIEKPWAVYGWYLGTWDIGRVVQKGRNSLDLQYIEGQMYPPESWDPKWVKTFRTSKEAIDCFFKTQSSFYDASSVKSITDRLIDDFPKAMKQESLQTIHDVLSAYAQTLPKCTPTVEEDWGPFGKHPNLKDGPIGPHPNIKY